MQHEAPEICDAQEPLQEDNTEEVLWGAAEGPAEGLQLCVVS